MTGMSHGLSFLRELVWQDLALILLIIVCARILILALRWTIRQVAECAPSRMRLWILALSPKARLAIDVLTILTVLPILVEPTFHNTVALIASVGIALAFAFKDYGSSLIAGLVTIIEGPYQPGDWIEVNGDYGEVKSIGVRAVRIVTADDTEVIIPHAKLWSTSIHNASSGARSMLCVANFYLNPDHDGALVRQTLAEIGQSSSYRKPETSVTVIVAEKPWGTQYRLKAYVKDSRAQYLFTSDLTVRGKAALRNLDMHFAQAPYAETEAA